MSLLEKSSDECSEKIMECIAIHPMTNICFSEEGGNFSF